MEGDELGGEIDEVRGEIGSYRGRGEGTLDNPSM